MNTKFKKNHSGFGVIVWIAMIPVSIIVVLILAIGFYEGRKAYWDIKVREMCEKDGGVVIFENVYITQEEAELLGRNNGKIAIPIKELASANAPFYSESKTTYIRDSTPKVWRKDVSIIQRADKEIVAEWIFYSRVGGDFPTIIGHPTYFGCPDLKTITSDLEDIFIVEGGSE